MRRLLQPQNATPPQCYEIKHEPSFELVTAKPTVQCSLELVLSTADVIKVILLRTSLILEVHLLEWMKPLPDYLSVDKLQGRPYQEDGKSSNRDLAAMLKALLSFKSALNTHNV